MEKTINEFAKGYKKGTTIKWGDVSITVNSTLPLRDVAIFVNNVVTSSYSDDGEYIPEVVNFLIFNEMVEMCTDFELPESTQERYELFYLTDLNERIKEEINHAQMADIVDAIRTRIDLKNRIRQVDLENKINNVYSSMNNLIEMLEAGIGKISAEDVSRVLSIFANGEFSEEKLAGAVIDEQRKKTE